MEPDSILFFIFFIVFVLLKALFVAGETAIVLVNDAKLKRQVEDGNKKAKKLYRVVKHPNDFINTMALGSVLCTILASLCASAGFFQTTRMMVQRLQWLPPGLDLALACLILAVCVALCITILGQFLPKKLASQGNDSFAYAICPFVRVSKTVLKLPLWISTVIADAIVRLFGIDPHKEYDEVTEEEILMMVDAGNEKGVIEESQKEMINNIFDFSDTTAGEIMTHRTEMIATPKNAEISQVVQIAIESGFSRIPVFEEDVDDIVGVVYVKDFLKLIGNDDNNQYSLNDFIRSVLYVPASQRCSELFRKFSESKAHIAVVIDEYGGTSGIITMEDLLESIVGSIQDEYDHEEADIVQLDETTFEIDGSTSLDEVEALLNIDFALEEEFDTDTLGGLMANMLGRIPKEHEHPQIMHETVEFTVLKVEDRRIAKIKAVRTTPLVPDEQDED